MTPSRLLGQILFAVASGISAQAAEPLPAPLVERGDPEDRSAGLDAIVSVAGGVLDHGGDARLVLALLLEASDPFAATHAATSAALAPDPALREALALALTTPFPLLGAGSVLAHLTLDPDPDVQAAARLAAAVRGIIV